MQLAVLLKLWTGSAGALTPVAGVQAVLLWQVEQSVELLTTGCDFGIGREELIAVVPLKWHVVQVVPGNEACPPGWPLNVTCVKLVVDLWQLSQAVPPEWIAPSAPTPGAGLAEVLPSWQDAHLPLTPA